ncbi:MAG: PAS domain S-box protein [Chrysiogenia bacterium]
MDEKENTRELVVVDVKRYKKVKRALQESEERYRQLFENVPIGIYRTTTDGRFIDANPALVKMLGYGSFEELAARNLEKDYFDVEYPRSHYVARLKREGEIKGLEAVWRRKDGTRIHVRENVKLTSGQAAGVFFEGTVEDITESKLAEEAQRIRTQQIEILSCIISKGNLAESLADMLEVILDCVTRPLDFDTSAIFLYDAAAKKMNLLTARGAKMNRRLEEKYLAVGNPPFSKVLKGEAVFVDNTREALPDLAKSWGWRMASSIPLLSKGRVIGALNMASRKRQVFSPEEKNILGMIGKEAGTLISKLQAETALRESEKYYRTLIDTSPDIIIVMNLAAKLLTVNQQFLKIGGYSYEEVIGTSTYDFVMGLDRVSLEKRTTKFVENRKTSGSDYKFKKKDGQVLPLEVSASLLYEDGGNPLGIIAIGRDISERKQAELNIAEKNKVLSILNEISLDLALMPPAADINEYISEKLMSITKAIYVGINQYNKDTRQLEFISAKTNSKILTEVNKILGKNVRNIKFDVSKAMYKEITSEIVGYRSTLHEASFGAITEKASSIVQHLFNIDHFIGMALVVENELIGAVIMAVAKGTPAVSTELLKSVSHIVSVSLRRRRAESQMVMSEEKFKKLFYISPDSFILSHLDDGRIVSVNKGFTKIFGYEENEVVGKTNTEINIHKNPGEHKGIIDALRTGGAIENFECWFVSKSGKNILGLVSVVIIVVNDEKYILHTIRDISKRKLDEEQLVFLSSITENTSDAIIVTGIDFCITYINKVAENFFGYRLDELKGKTPDLFNAEPEAERIQQETYKIVSSGKTHLGESLNRRKDGSTFYCEYKVMPLKDKDGVIYAYSSVQRDISERKRSQEVLRQSAETFRRTFEAIPDPAYIWTKEANGRVRLGKFNQAALQITNGGIKDFLGMQVEKLFVDHPDYVKKIHLVMDSGQRQFSEVHYCYKSTGESKWLLVDYVKTAESSVMVITKDVTERKETETRLLAYQEQLRALTSELTLIEEKERRRIASELHDQIGQNLALCKLKVAALESNLANSTEKSEMAAVGRLLECSIQDTRSLIFDLSPPVLYELGFTAALEWLAERIQEQFHVPVEFESRFANPELDDDRQVILFQVVRELLVNVGKHSQASQAKVILSLEEPFLKIQVNDDGVGFDASRIFSPKEKSGGFGFFSMRERLNYLGGGLEVKSKPGKGSQIILTVPLHERGAVARKENS